MVYKTVNHRCNHLVICKNTSPLEKLQVGRQQKAFAFVAVGYHPKQKL